MSINICVATRGHPRQLRETLMQTLANSTLSTTKAIVGLDNDDPMAANVKLPQTDKIIISREDREDSLGEKYNRCARTFDADIYVMLTDDEAIATSRWDEKIEEAARLFTDGLGVVYFGMPPVESSMPAGFAITKKFVDKMGFFMNPHHPYWWHDTTIDEVAHYTGRIVSTEIQMAYPYGYGKTRGLRDVSFWATFFDLMRPMRWRIAQSIIDDPDNDDQPFRKLQLKQGAQTMSAHFEQRNAKLRDPLSAGQFESNQSYDAPDDERYQRIKQKATELLHKERGVSIVESKAA